MSVMPHIAVIYITEPRIQCRLQPGHREMRRVPQAHSAKQRISLPALFRGNFGNRGGGQAEHVPGQERGAVEKMGENHAAHTVMAE